MRLFLFFSCALFFIASAKKTVAIPCVETADTCFYTIHVPADIDFPQTPYFDTTIVRSINCKTQVLKLPGWGTGTTYILTRDDSVINVNKEISFLIPQRYGMIDITTLPEGNYNMQLFACGNGGSFTLRLKW